MRYQERIYIQNEYNGVRNKDINIFNMSSDMCVFNAPRFSISGASKIDCTGSTSGNTYIVSADTLTIPMTFIFTANTSSFKENNALFQYQIYKYNPKFSGFSSTTIYKSDDIDFNTFSVTSATTQSIPVPNLGLDGEYIIKGFYTFDSCTNYLNKMGKREYTSNNVFGTQYGVYNGNSDYYFIAFKEAETPLFTSNGSNYISTGSLSQAILRVDDGTINSDPNYEGPYPTNVVTIPNNYYGSFVLTLNGLVLAKDLDYTVDGTVVTLSGDTVPDDVITVIYTSNGDNILNSDVINVATTIVSGATNNQGNSLIYYNTTTNKYEAYASVTPQDFNTMIVMLNGVTLANGIDFYQSKTNAKRIIFEGEIIVNDIITIIYFPKIDVVNALNTNNPTVSWYVSNPPTNNDGFFTLEVSSDIDFGSFYYTGTTDYYTDSQHYDKSFIATGTSGTKLYYRVKNTKHYTTICGNVLNSVVYSETIPITITTNSINSY
jgi:hypothetical protein